jgi:hypothetical protein
VEFLDNGSDIFLSQYSCLDDSSAAMDTRLVTHGVVVLGL